MLFVSAAFLNQKFDQREREIARDWYARGDADLAAGRAEDALDPLRTALVYSRNRPEYELRLGQALAAAQHYAEAQTYLLTLRERQPGSAALNLELARLAARRGDVSDAIHYYEASLYGVWESNGEQQRRAARLELIRYLGSHGHPAEAVAHTMSFAANLPPDPALHIQAGDLFMQEASYDHAAEQFRQVLLLEPHNAAALSGAGRAAFKSGDYAGAVRYLERAARLTPGDAALAEMLAVTKSALSIDPDAPGLSAEVRGARALHAFSLAQSRIEACPPPKDKDAAAALSALFGRAKLLEPKLHKNKLLRDVDLYTATRDFALDAELAAAAACGPGSVDDRALALLAARRHGGVR